MAEAAAEKKRSKKERTGRAGTDGALASPLPFFFPPSPSLPCTPGRVEPEPEPAPPPLALLRARGWPGGVGVVCGVGVGGGGAGGEAEAGALCMTERREARRATGNGRYIRGRERRRSGRKK